MKFAWSYQTAKAIIIGLQISVCVCVCVNCQETNTRYNTYVVDSVGRDNKVTLIVSEISRNARIVNVSNKTRQ